jgi:hypothetical protein
MNMILGAALTGSESKELQEALEETNVSGHFNFIITKGIYVLSPSGGTG